MLNLKMLEEIIYTSISICTESKMFTFKFSFGKRAWK